MSISLLFSKIFKENEKKSNFYKEVEEKYLQYDDTNLNKKIKEIDDKLKKAQTKCVAISSTDFSKRTADHLDEHYQNQGFNVYEDRIPLSYDQYRICLRD